MLPAGLQEKAAMVVSDMEPGRKASLKPLKQKGFRVWAQATEIEGV